MLRGWFKPLLPVVVVILIPLVPFLMFGEAFEARVIAWLKPATGPGAVFAAVAGLLASDIFLPIPSSMISTFGGARLGVWGGTAASWLGLTAGAVIGFALARWLGRPLAERFSDPQELQRMEQLSRRYGPLLIVFTRAVPLMAEASVLLFGSTGLTWRRFLPAVAAANLGIALAYSAFGDVAGQYDSLAFALAVSIALPVLAATMARRWLITRVPQGPLS